MTTEIFKSRADKDIEWVYGGIKEPFMAKDEDEDEDEVIHIFHTHAQN